MEPEFIINTAHIFNVLAYNLQDDVCLNPECKLSDGVCWLSSAHAWSPSMAHTGYYCCNLRRFFFNLSNSLTIQLMSYYFHLCVLCDDPEHNIDCWWHASIHRLLRRKTCDTKEMHTHTHTYTHINSKILELRKNTWQLNSWTHHIEVKKYWWCKTVPDSVLDCHFN